MESYYVPDDNEVAVLRKQVPSNAPNENLTDTFLAQELTKLTMNDRDKVYNDIHGIITNQTVEETPELLEDLFTEFQEEISKIKTKTAYDQAMEQNSQFVQNRDFRLQFIRTACYDPKKAALRFARHFAAKLDLFGENTLARDVTQADLDEEDLECLYAGYEQILPARDRAGRSIYIQVAHPKHTQQSEQAKVSLHGWQIALSLFFFWLAFP